MRIIFTNIFKEVKGQPQEFKEILEALSNYISYRLLKAATQKLESFPSIRTKVYQLGLILANSFR
jgi:hypothetical protein